MSEFPFAGETDDVQAGGETAGSRDRRTLLTAGALAVAVLGAGAYFFLGSGGSDDLSDDAPVTATGSTSRTTAARGATAQVPASTAVKELPAASAVETGRNPFKALYVVPVAAAKPAGVGTIAPTTATSGTVTGTAGTAVGTVTNGSVPGASGSGQTIEPVATKTYPLVLKSVTGAGTPVGTITVGDKTYNVPVGKVFGPSNEIVVVAFQQDGTGTWTAVLRVGESTPIDAKQGTTLNVM